MSNWFVSRFYTFFCYIFLLLCETAVYIAAVFLWPFDQASTIGISTIFKTLIKKLDNLTLIKIIFLLYKHDLLNKFLPPKDCVQWGVHFLLMKSWQRWPWFYLLWIESQADRQNLCGGSVSARKACSSNIRRRRKIKRPVRMQNLSEFTVDSCAPKR